MPVKMGKKSLASEADVRKEFDSQSTMSSASRASDNKRKSRRFSLRRFFYPQRVRSAKSQTSLEFETRSEFGMTSPPYPERDLTSSCGGKPMDKFNATDGPNFECPLCLTAKPRENFPPIMTCVHRSCMECLRQYLKIEITESRINISCPECSERFHPNDIGSILNNEALMAKYEQFMVRRVLVLDSDTRWCPAPDCGYAVIASGCAGCPKIRCERPGCNTYFCYHCKQHWHPNLTCDTARAKRLPNLHSASISYTDTLSHKDEIKPCPRCGAFIVKMDDGSCNHMTCAVCGAEFCWLCMQEISDLHYLSPSGCTFWGKKPWSRKKKILWQLGTLVGAPVGISLVASIAVPAIIIGVPVWVGRKLHSKYGNKTRHKRNLIIASGVVSSIILAPLLAGLSVGIGVPILLAYVYGVVPVSLCRSGGCGVHTTNSGVRFEFDDENDGAGIASVGYSGDNRSVDTTSHMMVGNPSIGPSIGEVSVGMTNSLSASGSHLDRAGAIRDESDRESASHRAIAGTSLSGSLNSSTMVGPNSILNRLEVQADISNNASLQKRASFSSDSANLSLNDKMSVAYIGDDASTRALFGSIGGGKDSVCNLTIPSLEIQDETTRRDSVSSRDNRAQQRSDLNRTAGLQPTDSGASHHSDKQFQSFYHADRQCQSVSASHQADRQSSPPSGRSVTFYEGQVTRHKKSRHHSLEVMEDASKCENLALAPRRQSADSRENPSIKVVGANTSNPNCAMNIVERVSPTGSLTEVESDRPGGFVARKISRTADNTLAEGPVLSNIVEEFKPIDAAIGDSSQSGSRRKNDDRRRRLSCEIAMRAGRLSPHSFSKI